jgi:exo-beta-1,3-glucanase (GH17 family)
MKLTSLLALSSLHFSTFSLALAISDSKVAAKGIRKSLNNDYGFLGFTYSSCKDDAGTLADFKLMKKLGARHVRMYGTCGNNWLSTLLDSAGATDLGVVAMIWYGYDNTTIDNEPALENQIVNITKTHKYRNNVVAIAVGNEELFDQTISADQLIQAMARVRSKLQGYNVPVSTSELSCCLPNNVVQATDVVMTNILPYFATDATQGKHAWKDVLPDVNKYRSIDLSKKFLITETYWAWKLNDWKPNSPNCSTSLQDMEDYWALLTHHCPDFKSWNAGYFAYCFNEDCMTGFGITDGIKPRIPWAPATRC